MSSEEAAKPEVWRLFVAIDLPDEVKDRLTEIRQVLQAAGWKARWSRPETMHLTLKFFGYRPVESIDELKAALRSVLTNEPRFEISTAEMGVFPSPRRPRVIWLGVQDRTGTLTRIAEAIETESQRLGIEPEDREFRPHLTIARVRPEDRQTVTDIEKHFNHLTRLKPIRVDVDHVTLYRSELRRSGAIYSVVERFDFGTKQ